MRKHPPHLARASHCSAIVTIVADLWHSARSLARTPLATLTLLLTIAAGTGSNASVAGFARGLFARNLPAAGFDEIVSVFAGDAQDGFGPVSYADYLSLKEQRDAFDAIGAARESRRSIGVGEQTTIMAVAAVTPDFADLLHLPPGEGVVLSQSVWQTEFGARLDVRGDLIRVDGVEMRIAGVAPDGLEGLYLGIPVDLWMPLPEVPEGAERRSQNLWAFGRLRPQVSRQEADTAVNATRNGAGVLAVLPYTGMTPEMTAGMLRIDALLSAAVSAVFIVACANVATLLLARASARSHETSIRVALGASRGRLFKELVADSVLISVTGGALGLLFGLWTTHLVPAALFDQDASQLVFVPDLFGILATSSACTGLTIVCGLVPILEVRDDRPAAVLQREVAGPSKAMRRLRAGLVVAQMTCCCMLVVSTALLLTSFRAALRTSLGHRLEQSVLATVHARGDFTRPDLGLEYFRGIEQAARLEPGISPAAWSGTPPGTRPGWQSIRVEPPRLPVREVVMDIAAFTPQSLAHVVLPPVAGRMFGGGDTPLTCRVAIVNEEAARDLLLGDAVGRSIEDPAGQRVEVIGVVSTRRSRVGLRPTPRLGRLRGPLRPAPLPRSGDTVVRNRPAVYYYAEQTGTLLDRVGPARFQVPFGPDPARGVLEAHVVSASYFEAIGLSATAGAVFPHDPTSDHCRVGVVNQAAAELYFGGNAAGGAVIDDAGRRTEIVGVVRSALLGAAQRREEPAIYLPMAQDYQPRMTLILNAPNASRATLASLRRRLAAVPGGYADRLVVTTLDDHLSRTSLAPERIALVLVGASTATGLALGVLGLYGAMAEAIRRRRRELALRAALGAEGWRIVRLVLGEGLRLAAAGTVAGMLGAWLLARWLTRITLGAGSFSAAWLGAPLVLLGLVALASVLPARRATAVDPLTVMREE